MEKRISEKYVNSKGITLIALVITIVVMLILVSVSIQVAMDSGLFSSAGKAVKDYREEQQKESNMKITIGGKVYNSVEEYIASNPGANFGINVKLKNMEQPVTADGIKVGSITEGTPIPVGYYYVGGTKNTGVVISDDSADANKGVDADLVGNQFVWVPVLQNQRIELNIKLEDNISAIVIEDPIGTVITTDAEGNTILPSGKEYTGEIIPTINGKYTVTVATGTGDDKIVTTLKVTSLYAQYFDSMTKEDIKEEYTLEEFKQNYLDDDGNVVNEWLEEDYGTALIEDAYELEIQDLYEQEIGFSDITIATYSNSVDKYGGFYIGRYEAGSDTIRSKGDTLENAYSKKNKYPYNWLTQSDSITLSQAMDNGSFSVTSDLINAAAWDRTLQWLVETNAVTEEQIKNSESWGNHTDSSFEIVGKYSTDEGTSFAESSIMGSYKKIKQINENYLLGTGVTEYTKRNNIYDLAGNCYEWTTEKNNETGDVIARGAYYSYISWWIPVNGRISYSNTLTNYMFTFRPTLYIN